MPLKQLNQTDGTSEIFSTVSILEFMYSHPREQVATKRQFFKRSLTGFNSEFTLT